MRGTISRGLLRWKLEMHIKFENRLYYTFYRNTFTGIVISSNCWPISFLLEHHNLNATDLLLKTTKQEVVMLFVTFQQK